MMKWWMLIYNWLSVLQTVNEEVLQVISAVRKDPQHGFARADDVPGGRAEAAQQAFRIAIGTELHSQLDQRREFQARGLQHLQFSLLSRINRNGPLWDQRAANAQGPIYLFEYRFGLGWFGDYVHHAIRFGDAASFAFLIGSRIENHGRRGDLLFFTQSIDELVTIHLR